MADKIFVCTRDECKIGFEKYAYLKSHFAGKHPGETIPTEGECGVDSLPEGYTMRTTKATQKAPVASNTVNPTAQEQPPRSDPPPPPAPQSKTVYRETGDPSGILKNIMSTYPGMSEAVVNEVMSWVEVKGTLHPMEVRHLLSQMAGVPKGAPDIISQKYQLAVTKAASEGDSNIQMTLSQWYNTPQQAGESPLTMMPGHMFPQQPFNQTGMPPLQYGIPYQPPSALGYPNYPGFQYGPYNMQSQQPPPQDGTQSNPELEARFGQVNEAVAGLTNLVETLSKQIIETEEQKKEEALIKRIEGIENAILQLINAPKKDEVSDAVMENLKGLQAKIEAMHEETTANKISSLEERIGTLTEALAQNKDNEIKSLKNQLDEVKKIASEKPPVTGRTEMDIVGDLANKIVEKAGEAGKDVRAVVMRQANAQDFNPNRNSSEDRARLGNRIASVVEDEALLEQKEDQFRYQ
jgi:hypothetical protein